MSILAVGSIAFDSIKTPYGECARCLGGSATHFSLSASYFTDVRVVGPVGEDFGPEHEGVLKNRGVDTRGIQRAPGKSFFWAGEYGDNPNEAKLLALEVGVFADFKPQIAPELCNSEFLFLGNIDPVLQVQVRKLMPKAKLVAMDTHPFWIETKSRELEEAISVVDILMVNDSEARLMAREHNLPRAALKILAKGPKALVIKHGEYGATAFFRDGAFGMGPTTPFRAPTLPIEEVKDPTGAGDAFAGGFFGYIAAQDGLMNPEIFKRAMFYGGVMGSFAVEDFGTRPLESLDRERIEERFQLFRQLTHLP